MAQIEKKVCCVRLRFLPNTGMLPFVSTGDKNYVARAMSYTASNTGQQPLRTERMKGVDRTLVANGERGYIRVCP